MNCLVLSDTFPNRLAPWRGPYNRRQVECLSRLCRLTVINPIPFVRVLSDRRYWALRSGPDPVLDGVSTYHPIFWYLPVLGRGATWRAVLSAIKRILRGPAAGDYDRILATFAYPHGAAARALSQRMGIPYAIKVRGSDLHGMPRSGARRERTVEALSDAAAIICVSRNLAAMAIDLGARADALHTLPNGVDAAAFPLLPREDARKRLGLPVGRKILLFVGSLLPVKGVDILIDAFARLRSGEDPEIAAALLAFAGEGPMRKTVETRGVAAGLADSVRFLGQMSREEVALWMNAADALVLPSRNEGCPNVVLEALCCGTPVVAARVGAVPDLIDESCGAVVAPDDPDVLARGIAAVLRREWPRSALRRRVEGMSWEANAQRLHDILAGMVE